MLPCSVECGQAALQRRFHGLHNLITVLAKYTNIASTLPSQVVNELSLMELAQAAQQADSALWDREQ